MLAGLKVKKIVMPVGMIQEKLMVTPSFPLAIQMVEEGGGGGVGGRGGAALATPVAGLDLSIHVLQFSRLHVLFALSD